MKRVFIDKKVAAGGVQKADRKRDEVYGSRTGYRRENDRTTTTTLFFPKKETLEMHSCVQCTRRVCNCVGVVNPIVKSESFNRMMRVAPGVVDKGERKRENVCILIYIRHVHCPFESVTLVEIAARCVIVNVTMLRNRLELLRWVSYFSNEIVYVSGFHESSLEN